ncbi:alpha/beta fold hydrolase [Jejuia spongiicola]|uniref:Alpha/beta hydrolase n=1 Tax=Jejuia spongiicola TaxID=2942207 RepID=A0ABT0QIE8_9FLAO|nr:MULTISPECIES: alpha/beta hydrolase [Flavobacteriaceae]MCL6296645.1 alpha/beta hydrolase [Jejuia spongiicola]PIA80695.1 alpha/beta hydrolase [Gaetbulibacter sp. 4G1]
MKKKIKKAIPKIVGSLINTTSHVSKTYAANKAMALFAKPRKGKITLDQAKYLKSSKQLEFEYNGLKIMTYQWVGNEKTILLVHGWESNTARWKNLISVLEKYNYNIIALDAPAHGNSGSETFNAILYSEFINIVSKKFQPEIIIGHSVGGMASIFFQKEYPLASLKKMILLGAPNEFKDIFKNYINLLNYNSKVVNALEDLVVKRFGAPSNSFSTAKYSTSIKVDGLIIHDKKDKIIPFNDSEAIHKNLKNSKLIQTSGYGHSLNNNVVHNHIIEFIND